MTEKELSKLSKSTIDFIIDEVARWTSDTEEVAKGTPFAGGIDGRLLIQFLMVMRLGAKKK